jgi:hypothetical protein
MRCWSTAKYGSADYPTNLIIAARIGNQRYKPDFHRWEGEALRSSDERGTPSPTAEIRKKQIQTKLLITENERRLTMLFTIAAVLAILWLLGFVTSYTMGGFIHVLLVLAIVVVLIRIIQGRKLA